MLPAVDLAIVDRLPEFLLGVGAVAAELGRVLTYLASNCWHAQD